MCGGDFGVSVFCLDALERGAGGLNGFIVVPWFPLGTNFSFQDEFPFLSLGRAASAKRNLAREHKARYSPRSLDLPGSFRTS